jgi:hypothetical protein
MRHRPLTTVVSAPGPRLSNLFTDWSFATEFMFIELGIQATSAFLSEHICDCYSLVRESTSAIVGRFRARTWLLLKCRRRIQNI